ncbi:hypothetical protein GCM10009557_74900 [Virgisporangium ochraceum]|uniref:Response regulatory domain-containing protein n=1 Tax=Virgisporangium ochraceum TaxID=65505 RepID=A0A8J4EGR0_9ACTN|nr:response regulator transcription factor [Virgisporangium ochraceum]GIJ75055.1 hypothetical protein Voc01_099720 [Virgisporangium ochraceum]
MPAVRVVVADDHHVFRLGMRKLLVAIGLILRRDPSVRILVLTMHADDALVARALRAGARGYVVKDAPPEDILRAIRAVHANQAILDPAVAHALLSDGRTHRWPALPGLTERDLGVASRAAAVARARDAGIGGR